MASPYDVPHTGSDLKALAAAIKKLRGETRVVMEATGNYYEPIAHFLHEQGIFVSVVNPMLISDFGGNTLRKPKTDKKDAVKLALYTLTYWLDLKRYRSPLLLGITFPISIQWEFPITFETARAYQKSKGKYLREYQWQDMYMAVRIEFGK